MNVRKLRITIAVAACAIGVAYLVFAATDAEGIAYKTTARIRIDARAKPPISSPESARLTGKVAAKSIIPEPSGLGARFVVVDAEQGLMSVRYSGAIPDAFRDGAEVVVTGTYDRNSDLFNARELLTKCPSKYEAAYESGATHPTDAPMTKETP